MSKIQLNIVYLPQTNPSHIIYENEHAQIWHSKEKHSDKINIALGWYSIREPESTDNLLAIEPFCVSPMDYDPNFAGRFNKIFTWAKDAFVHPKVRNKIVHIKHPTYHDYPDWNTVDNNWVPWKDRSNEIIFIANKKTATHDSELYSLRMKLVDMLSSYSKFEISWYGHTRISKPWYKGSINDKREVLRKAKFSICIENSYDPIYSKNYFTEKLPDVWMAGAVPIYMGCHNVDEYGLPENSYIDLRAYVNKQGKQHDIDQQALLNRIERYTEESYNEYKDSIINNVFKSNKLESLSSYPAAYETMIATFRKPE